MRIHRFAPLILMMMAWSGTALAAEGTDACTGYISTLPATIDRDGTWCLRKNLSIAGFANPFGMAVYIQSPYVTIDCNHFGIADTVVQPTVTSYGIYTNGLVRATVRNCTLRGFSYGIYLQAPGGTAGSFIVEGNRTDHNGVGIAVTGNADGSVVRDNQVLRSGACGIIATGSADILGNTVSGVVAPAASNNGVTGISESSATGGRIEGNEVRGLLKDGTGRAEAIEVSNASYVTVRNNTVVGDGNPASSGVVCSTASARLQQNVIVGFATAIDGCADAGGNDSSP